MPPSSTVLKPSCVWGGTSDQAMEKKSNDLAHVSGLQQDNHVGKRIRFLSVPPVEEEGLDSIGLGKIKILLLHSL